MTTTFTTNFRLPIPDFQAEPWHALLQAAIQAVDGIVYNVLIANNTIPWANSTAYNIGMLRIDTSDGSIWLCRVSHTSPSSSTFAAARTATPSDWSRFVSTFNPRGQYANNTAYAYYDMVYDPTLKIIALCTTAYTSGASPANLNTESTNWVFIANFPAATTALSVTYDHTVSGLAAITVQAAIDELVVDLGTTNTAVALKAPLASPVLTGNPTAPTATVGDNDTSIATTAFVQAALAALGIGTGSAMLTLETAAPAGWVLMDDGTIGDASSSATTRANADTVNLYTLIYNNISNTFAPVTGGRGANAAADFAAHKPIALTKQLGRALCISGAGSGLTSHVLGTGNVGEETHQMTIPELPVVTPAGTIGGSQNLGSILTNAGPNNTANTGSYNFSIVSGVVSGSNFTFTGTPFGSGTAHNNMQPSTFWNIKVKL